METMQETERAHDTTHTKHEPEPSRLLAEQRPAGGRAVTFDMTADGAWGTQPPDAAGPAAAAHG